MRPFASFGSFNGVGREALGNVKSFDLDSDPDDANTSEEDECLPSTSWEQHQVRESCNRSCSLPEAVVASSSSQLRPTRFLSGVAMDHAVDSPAMDPSTDDTTDNRPSFSSSVSLVMHQNHNSCKSKGMETTRDSPVDSLTPSGCSSADHLSVSLRNGNHGTTVVHESQAEASSKAPTTLTPMHHQPAKNMAYSSLTAVTAESEDRLGRCDASTQTQNDKEALLSAYQQQSIPWMPTSAVPSAMPMWPWLTPLGHAPLAESVHGVYAPVYAQPLTPSHPLAQLPQRDTVLPEAKVVGVLLG